MSLKKNTGIQLIIQIFTAVVGFVAGIFLTRYLGPEGKGILAKIDASAQLFLMLFSFNAVMGITYFTANNKLSKATVWATALLSLVTTVGIIVAMVFALEPLGLAEKIFPRNYYTTIGIGYLITMVVLTQFKKYFSAFFRGHTMFMPVFIISVVQSILNLIVYVTLYYSSGAYNDTPHILVVFGANILISIIIFCIWFGFFKLKLNVKPKFDIDWKKNLKTFYRFSLISYSALILNFLNNKLDIWLVDSYLNSTQLGYYALAVNVAGLLLLMSQAFRGVLFPYLTKGTFEENVQTLKFFSRINFSATLLISIALFVGTRFIIMNLYGAEFEPSIVPLRILIVALTIMSFRAIFSMYNFARDKAKYNLIANIVGVIFTVVLNIILLPRLGIKGAALASLITYSISTSIILYSIFITQGIPIGNYFFVSKGDYAELKVFIQKKFGNREN